MGFFWMGNSNRFSSEDRMRFSDKLWFSESEMNFPDDVPESNIGSNGRKFYLDAVFLLIRQLPDPYMKIEDYKLKNCVADC